MKKLIAAAFTVLAAPISSLAEINVQASLSGSSTVNTKEVIHHRKSADCYPFGKGDDENQGAVSQPSFNGDRTVNGSGQVSWGSDISAPFVVRARTTVLTSTVSPLGRGERLALTLTDSFASAIGTVHSEKCRRTDGHVSVNNATTSGSIKIQYRVPAGVWAIELSRVSAEGAFSISNIQPVTSAFNKDSDSKKMKNVILWVQPGQMIEQEIKFSSLGSANIGSLTLDFTPLSHPMSIDENVVFLKNVMRGEYKANMSEAKARDFLFRTMELVHSEKQSAIYSQNFALHELKTLSDEYFRIANMVFPQVQDGNAVKVASAIAAFQIARAVLIDMKAYCQEVDVQLPFTGETQKVLGLKAASFWLTRSMNLIRTYSYNPVEVFVEELESLQSRGITPANIMKDKALKKKIQASYILLTQNMSFDGGPFNRAYVDFNKLAKTFTNIQSLGSEQANLLQQLKAANQSEAEFIQVLGTTMGKLNPSTTEKVDYQPVLAKVAELRALQTSLSEQLKQSVRLLSIESSNEPGQIVNKVIDLLTNQVNVFKNPVNVPYFDGIRKAFYDANVSGLDGVANGCFNIGKVN